MSLQTTTVKQQGYHLNQAGQVPCGASPHAGHENPAQKRQLRFISRSVIVLPSLLDLSRLISLLFSIHPSIMSVTTKATIASFGGKLLKLSHNATTTRCEMSFNLYLPPQAQDKKVPVLIYLSGLTCTAENCSEKGFFQHGASQKGIAVLYPDTSPRTSYPWFSLISRGHTGIYLGK